MFERMDARVRAGRRVPSNAGNIDGFIVDARTSGVLLFGYCSLGQARESNSTAPKAMSKALDLPTANSRSWMLSLRLSWSVPACAGMTTGLG
ncbi:MAG: hypothetical protein R3F12_08650 [Lysobacteraceae bacterium]